MKSANIKSAVLVATISFSLQINASVIINNADIENVVLHDVITTDAGIDVSGQKITGLAEGMEGTDSANMNQLNRTDAKATAAQSAAEQAIKDADEKSATAEKNANNYTDSQINTVNGGIDNLDGKVDENRKKASAGIAGAMAMSSIPQNLSYDFNFGMGMANFDSEQAISAGGYYRVNERTIVSVKASFDTQNNLGAAAGVSYGW